MDEEDYSCDHLEIEDNVCSNCGYMLDDDMMDYSDRINMDDPYYIGKAVKKEEFNYLHQLAILNLEKEVCMYVCDQISNLKEKTHVRVGTHVKNLFVMIYIAYNIKEIIFCPYELGRKLGMTDKKIKESVRIASEGIDSHGIQNPVCIYSPSNYIRKFAEYNKDLYVISEKNFKKIEELIDKIIFQDKMLSNENPAGIAVTILKMFYCWNNIPFLDFIKKSGRTVGYVKCKENNIIKILNQMLL